MSLRWGGLTGRNDQTCVVLCQREAEDPGIGQIEQTACPGRITRHRIARWYAAASGTKPEGLTTVSLPPIVLACFHPCHITSASRQPPRSPCLDFSRDIFGHDRLHRFLSALLLACDNDLFERFR